MAEHTHPASAPDPNRREVLSGMLAGGCALLAGGTLAMLARTASGKHLSELDRGEHEYTRNDPENIINTVCLGCNTGCPTKAKIQNGTIVKIDGNAYGPWGRQPHLAYATPPGEAARTEAVICPKGQAGMFTAYDPYRLRKVIKRDGPRGSMRWKTIDFHEAIDEIVNGGRLFAHVPGEEDRHVEGIKDIWALRDPALAGAMSAAVEEIWQAKTPDEKQQKVAAFQQRFADHLDMLIDPDHPDLGPRNNQFLWLHGRLKNGRSQFFRRFVQEGLGSRNFHGHTTVCQGSLYYAGKAMSSQWGFHAGKGREDWLGGDKFYWQADQRDAEFILFVGASPFEANYGPPMRTPPIMEGITSGRLKIAVVDPRFSKTASKAWKWLPARPGSEAALALAMIRWTMDNERYDRRFLACANKAAAGRVGEANWSNSSWLVKIEDGRPGSLLRASDLGLGTQTRTSGDVSYEFDPFIALVDGNPVTVDPNDATTPVHGQLLVDGEVGGHRVKSSLQLLLDEARRHTMEQWAEICGVQASDIVDLAREFTSHGKKACADIHRGVAQHTNGFYNCLAFNCLNLLIGNYDWRGGMVKGASYDINGARAQGPFPLGRMNPGAARNFGLGVLRERDFEDTTLFNGRYPARRPWFPHATDIFQEVLPSVAEGYPYPIKVLLMYMGTPGYSLPAGQTQIAILADTSKVPLHIASDIVVGESTMYADYIFPDLSMYERWEFQGTHFNNIFKVQPVRQPAIAPIPETVRVFGQEMPISLESFMMAVAEKMGLPGFGPDAFGPGQHLLRPEDFYLRQVANLAWGERADGSQAVPEADDAEMAIFRKARRHLPASVFDTDVWQAAVGEHWRRVVTVLNRGGRFQDHDDAYDGEQVANKYGKFIGLYCEKIARSRNSMTGEPLVALPTYLPIADSIGRPFVVGPDDLHLITHREIYHTKSRTPGIDWLRELMPENAVLINARDAERLDLRDGQRVRVVSPSNPEGVWALPNFVDKPMIGRVKVTEGIRPGVVTFSLGHGHWAYGAADMWMDGEKIPGDARRGTGIHANAAMAIDPHLKNVALQDVVGGSVSFYDSPVRLVRI